VQDALGNTVTTATTSITLTIGTNPASGTLSGTTTGAAVSGVAAFSTLSIDKVGTGYTLSAAATGLTGATSSTFNVTPGPASSLAFTTEPATTTAGTGFGVVVTARDAKGNTATGFTGTVAVAITSGTGTAGAHLSGTASVAAVGGVATFSGLSVDSAGTGYTLTAAATGLAGTSSGFNVTFGAASKLAFTVQPTIVAAGTAITPAVQVTIQDAKGNTVTTATTSITVAIGTNPASGSLSGTATVAAVSGVATFSNLSINVPGAGYTLTAAASGLTGATSSAFNVTIGAPAKLVFTVQPSTVSAGTNISPAVQVAIQDAHGNTVPTATDSVALAIGTNPGSATLGGTVKVKAVAGVATFSAIQVSTAGIGYTLVASSGSLTGATSATFNVGGAATKLVFTVQPTNTVVNATITPAVTVTVQDALGQTVTSATNSVTMAIGTNPGSATLGGTATVSAASGVATFSNLSLSAAGTGYTLTAAASGLVGATSTTFNVAAFGVASKLAFLVQPTNVNAAAAISPPIQVAIQDPSGNTVTSNSSASVTLSFATNPGSATLGGTVTVTAANGIATFGDITVSAAGSGYALAATSGSLAGATSTTFNVVTPGTAVKLGFVQQPTSTTAGSVIVPAVTVAVQNGSGGTVTGDNTTVVSMTIGSGPGPLRGTLSATAVNGVATFSTLSDTVAGAYTLQAGASGLTSATSASYAVSAGVASELLFLMPPSNTRAGDLFNPVVRVAVADNYGNTVPSATNSVTLSNATVNGYGCSGESWQLKYTSQNCNFGQAMSPPVGGTLMVAAVGGVATFADLRPRFTDPTSLTFSATGMSDLSSRAFTVAPSSASRLWARLGPWFDLAPTDTANVPFLVETFILDSLNNQLNVGSNVVSLAIGTNPGAGTLSVANNIAATNGEADFRVTIDKGGSGYTLVPSTAGLSSVPSFAFNVAPFGKPARLGFVVQPSSAAVGAAISPAVQVCVQDGVGNTVTTASDSITVAIGTNPGSATLGGTLRLAATSGCATFGNLTLSAAATGYTLTAIDKSTPSLTGATSNPFNITP